MTKHSGNSEFSSVSSEFNKMVELHKEAENMREDNPSKAMAIAKNALEIANNIKNREYQYHCNYILGYGKLLEGDLDHAHQFLSLSLDIAQQYFAHDKEKLSITNNILGVVYYNQNNIELALDHFMKASQFKVEKDRIKIYNNLGNIHAIRKKHRKALEYYNLALSEAKNEKDHFTTATLLLNTSKSLAHYKNFKQAKKNTQDALILTNEYMASDARFALLRIYILLNLADLHINEENFDKATAVVNEAMSEADKMSAHECYGRSLYHKTCIQLKKGSEELALPLLHQTLEYANQHQLQREKKDMLEQVIAFYEQLQQYDKAYPFLKEFHILTKEEAVSLKEQNFKRIISGSEKEIASLKNKNKDAEDHNLLLEQFAHIISHDLKEPIRNIVSFSSLLNKRYYQLLDNDGREFLKYLIKGVTMMDQNLNRLLDFTTLKMIKNEEIQKISFSQITEELLDYHKEAIEPFEVSINCPDGYFNMVYSHAYALLDEIVANAIRFRKRGMNCYIEINSEIEEMNHHISIKDYGIGIEPEFRKQIFRIFNRLNKKEYDGSGVGLAICERIIQLYRGKIWIESDPDIYTTIHILIPVHRH